MASSSGGIKVHIYGDYDDKDIKKAQRDLEGLKTQSAPTASGLGGVGSALKGMGIAAVAGLSIGVVTDYLKDAATAAIADEKSMVALATAMDNVGQGFAKVDAEGFIKQLMLATGVADDELRPAFQRLVTATGDAAKSQELLQTALDISAATGKDVVSVSQALAKASTGQISALTRLGVPLDANIVKTKNFGAAVTTLNDKFGGQAAAAADTYGGKLKRLEVAAGEAQETIGYALLNSIEDVSKAFGLGADGATDMITVVGDVVANLITGTGQIAASIADFTAALKGNEDASTDWGNVLVGISGPILGPLAKQIEMLNDWVEDNKEKEEAAAAANKVLADRYTGLAAAVDPAKAAFLGIADATDDTTDSMEKAKTAADFLKASLDQFATKDNFTSAIREMGKAAAKAKGDLDGTKDASINLRGEFSNAASTLLTYAQTHGRTADEVLRLWDKGVEAIKQKLIDKGIKPKDVDAFVNPVLWQTKFTLLADSIGKGRAAEAMRLAGLAAGNEAWQGMVAALASGDAKTKVYDATYTLGRVANAGARAALESASPSKVFFRIGNDIVDGLIIGMDSKKQEVAQKASDMMQALSDKAAEQIGKWDTTLDTLKGKLDTAQDTVRTWASGTQQSLLGAFNLQSAFTASIGEDGKVVGSKWIEGVDAQLAKMKWYSSVLSTIQGQGPEAQGLVDYLISQGADQGGAMGQAMIDQGLVPTMVAKFNEVQTTSAGLTAGLIPTWMTAGVESAQATYEGFKKNFGVGGPARVAMENLMDRVASSLARQTTITVKTVYEAAGLDGQRASGVGERGPEIITMGTSGYVTPNSALSGTSTGSKSYNINVSTGVGDPRQIGQQVVEYIRRFEQSNGPVYARAS